jgi:hypothetical protein
MNTALLEAFHVGNDPCCGLSRFEQDPPRIPHYGEEYLPHYPFSLRLCRTFREVTDMVTVMMMTPEMCQWKGQDILQCLPTF